MLIQRGNFNIINDMPLVSLEARARAAKYSLVDRPPPGAGFVYVITNEKLFPRLGNRVASYIGKTTRSPYARFTEHFTIKHFTGSGKYPATNKSPLQWSIGTAFGYSNKMGMFNERVRLDIIGVYSLYSYNVAEAKLIQNSGIATKPSGNVTYRDFIELNTLNLKKETGANYGNDQEFPTSRPMKIMSYHYFLLHDYYDRLFNDEIIFNNYKFIREKNNSIKSTDTQINLIADILTRSSRATKTWETAKTTVQRVLHIIATGLIDQVYHIYMKNLNITNLDWNIAWGTILSKPSQNIILKLKKGNLVQSDRKVGSTISAEEAIQFLDTKIKEDLKSKSSNKLFSSIMQTQLSQTQAHKQIEQLATQIISQNLSIPEINQRLQKMTQLTYNKSIAVKAKHK
jgi:hypothetical protein